jgi:hypothetical protein
MPALPSSPAPPVIGHLVAVSTDAGDDAPGLLAVLAKVTDPRHRRACVTG